MEVPGGVGSVIDEFQYDSTVLCNQIIYTFSSLVSFFFFHICYLYLPPFVCFSSTFENNASYDHHPFALIFLLFKNDSPHLKMSPVMYVSS